MNLLPSKALRLLIELGRKVYVIRICSLCSYKKGAYLFGRDGICDFALEHPSISRFHAGD